MHDAAEPPTNPAHTVPDVSGATPRHAECEDCHNPHATNAQAATAPKRSGKIAGVWGLSRTNALVQPSGAPASVNEYEICFKCHADSANMPQATGAPAPPYPNRAALQWNKRLHMDSTAVSYHPIEAPAKATTSPSLTSPLALTSVILCTDCHDSNTRAKSIRIRSYDTH